MEEGLQKLHSLFFFWKGMIFVDYFIEFLIMMVASVFGILIGARLVDLFQKLRMKWRRHK